MIDSEIEPENHSSERLATAGFASRVHSRTTIRPEENSGGITTFGSKALEEEEIDEINKISNELRVKINSIWKNMEEEKIKEDHENLTHLRR